MGRDIYGGTYRILTTVFRRWKLEVTFVDSTDPDLVRRAIRPETRGLFVETPANPLLQITDLRAMAAIARERPVPVYFIGVGEKLEDLETFNAREFAQALLS